MKVKQLIDAIPALQKVAQQEFQISTLRRVRSLMEIVDAELGTFYSARDELLAKFGVEVSPSKWEIPADKIDLYNEQLEFLVNRETVAIPEVEISEDEPIRLSYTDLCKLQGFLTIQEGGDTQWH